MGQLISTYGPTLKCVAIGPVSTADTVGDIAARFLRTVCKSAGQLAAVESSEGHITLQMLKAHDLMPNPDKNLAGADANQLWLDRRFVINSLLVMSILLQ